MNENCRKLVEMFRDGRIKPDEFDMGTFYSYKALDHSCGSVACIAGHAILAFGYEDEKRTLKRQLCRGRKVLDVENTARRLLGLSSRQANTLFYQTSVVLNSNVRWNVWDNYDRGTRDMTVVADVIEAAASREDAA